MKTKTRKELEDNRNAWVIVAIVFFSMFVVYSILYGDKIDNLQTQLSECQDKIPEWNSTKIWKDTMCEQAFIHKDSSTIKILNCQDKVPKTRFCFELKEGLDMNTPEGMWNYGEGIVFPRDFIETNCEVIE